MNTHYKKLLVMALITTTVVTPKYAVTKYQRTMPEVEVELFYEFNTINRELEAKGEIIRREREAEEQRILRELEELKSRQPIFNPYDLTETSNLSRDQIHQMLSGTALESLVDAFYWYEQQYKVNVIFVMSVVALESWWGRSELAITHNNLSGYTDSVNGGFKYFNNWGESLEETFRLLSEEYLNSNGVFYQESLDIYTVNVLYCTQPGGTYWSEEVITIANELLAKLN